MENIYARAAADVAREAGEFLRHFSERRRLKIERKGSDRDFVTNADRQSQQLIEERLKALFPSHRFVGEEDGLSDEAIADMLKNGGEDDYFWVCDPLDGTVNYIHHVGIYATSVGLIHKGQSIAGAICVPERGEVYWGARGMGAFVNDMPLCASSCASRSLAYVCTDMPVSDLALRETYMTWLSNVAQHVSNQRMMGSACFTMAMAAAGHIDAYYNLGVHAWDVAAGIVIARESGCVVTDMFSNPFDFDMKRGVLCSAPGLDGAFRDLIRERQDEQ